MNNDYNTPHKVSTFMDSIIPRMSVEDNRYRTLHNTPDNSPQNNDLSSPHLQRFNMDNIPSNYDKLDTIDGELLFNITSMKISLTNNLEEKQNNLNIVGKKRKLSSSKSQLRDSFESPSIRCRLIKGEDSETLDEITHTMLNYKYKSDDVDFDTLNTGLVYKCQGDNINKSYRVKLTIENGVTEFTCNCNSDYTCLHIKESVRKIMFDLSSSIELEEHVLGVVDSI
jgi:hypothetical protein